MTDGLVAESYILYIVLSHIFALFFCCTIVSPVTASIFLHSRSDSTLFGVNNKTLTDLSGSWISYIMWPII